MDRFIVFDHVDDWNKVQQYRDLLKTYKEDLGAVTLLYFKNREDVKITEDLDKIHNDDVTEIDPNFIFKYAADHKISEIHFLLANDIFLSNNVDIPDVKDLKITLNYVILEHPNYYLFDNIREKLEITPTLKKGNKTLEYFDFRTITLEDTNDQKLKLHITEDERTKLIFDKTAEKVREMYENSFLIFNCNKKRKETLNNSARHYIRISEGTITLFCGLLQMM